MKPNSPLSQFLILLALTGFTITEPVLSIFGADPPIFFSNGISLFSQVVTYALAVALVPAVLLWLTIATVRQLSIKLSLILFHAVTAVLAALWIIQLLKWTVGLEHATKLAILAAAGAGLFLVALRKSPYFRSLLEFGSISPFLFLIAFLYFSDMGALSHTTERAATDSSVNPSANTARDASPSVLFLIFDEFPTLSLFNAQGLIDANSFPNFAQLSEQATWFRHYTVVADSTVQSVPAILSGLDPVATTPDYRNFPRNLFSMLAPTHHLTVYEGVTKLCGLPTCSVGPPGSPVVRATPRFRNILNKSAELWLERISLRTEQPGQLDDFTESIERVESASEPSPFDFEILNDFLHEPRAAEIQVQKPKRVTEFMQTFSADHTALYYLHLLLPHVPWLFYEDGEMYRMPSARPLLSYVSNEGSEWLAKISAYRFLLQARYADALLGDIINKLKVLGLWDDMLVVVTSDHGRSFRPGTGFRSLQQASIDTIAYAPLLVKAPGQTQGAIDDSNMMSYDVLPTLAEILELDVAWPFPGFPAGHPEIAARNGEKVFFRSKNEEDILSIRPGEKLTFKDEDHFPDYKSRYIGAKKPGESAINLLLADLPVQDYLGKSPADYNVVAGGRATVDELKELQTPASGVPKLGAVMGNLDFEPAGNIVLVSINNRFVSASPLITFRDIDHSFVAFLPQNTLGPENDVAVYLIEASGLRKLDIQ